MQDDGGGGNNRTRGIPHDPVQLGTGQLSASMANGHENEEPTCAPTKTLLTKLLGDPLKVCIRPPVSKLCYKRDSKFVRRKAHT